MNEQPEGESVEVRREMPTMPDEPTYNLERMMADTADGCVDGADDEHRD